ncbi:MAG: DUF4911 domain-containing protein [Deltaproteobacteria bacterium]|nr:DUF4911 domain-containing protein [Deltaproteobacteria bacterium]
MKTRKYLYRVNRKEICYIQAILEGYDGLATMSTLNPGEAIIEIAVSPGRENELEMLIYNLGLNGMRFHKVMIP